MKFGGWVIAITLAARTGIGDAAAGAKSPQSTGEVEQDLAYVAGVVREYASQKYRQMDTAASIRTSAGGGVPLQLQPSGMRASTL